MFEIISADSVQVYRYLDVGSGKLPVADRMGIPHHLIDEVLPDFLFDTAEYCRRAQVVCEDIYTKGKIPLFVGGTGFYIDSFFQGLSPVPDINPDIRETLEQECVQKGLDAMHKELSVVDPDSANRIHVHDRQRVLRALQVYRGTGRTLHSYREKRAPRESDQTFYMYITRERPELEQMIEKRVDGMIESGFIDEVDSLRKKGYTARYNSMKSIGYFELGEYLDGIYSREETISRIKSETKEYARKQGAWFRRNKKMHIYEAKDSGIQGIVSQWLDRFTR
jgi:tRNA dimethylallyltransferase